MHASESTNKLEHNPIAFGVEKFRPLPCQFACGGATCGEGGDKLAMSAASSAAPLTCIFCNTASIRRSTVRVLKTSFAAMAFVGSSAVMHSITRQSSLVN